MQLSLPRLLLLGAKFVFLVVLWASPNLKAVIRDGGIDPANLGKGDWIYSMKDATNKLGGHAPGVTNEVSLMQFYKSVGVRYIIIKAATSDQLFNDCGSSPQFTSALVNIAKANGILIFGYNRSYGENVAGEVAISDYIFQQGADGFVWDAEAEWESNKPWIGTNGPSKAWQLCSTVRSNWPNKFLAHAPFPIIYLHQSFPYKEFGYWSDAIMPQIYHFSQTFTPGLKGSQSSGVNWTDVNWNFWHNSLYSLPVTNINGVTVNWTNAIKPIAPVHDVYGEARTASGLCQGSAGALPDKHVTEFMDYLLATPNCPSPGGYKGVNYWRADLHGTNQWKNIKAGTSGNFTNIVNHVVVDSPQATIVGAWNFVRAFSNSVTAGPTNITTSALYISSAGSDTNTFGIDYWMKTRGDGSSYAQFNPKVITAGDYNLYRWHPMRAEASTNVPFVINFNGGSTTVFANQKTNAGDWTLLGLFPFAAGTNGSVRITDDFPEASGVALVDGLKLMHVAQTSIPLAPTNLTATLIGSNQVNLAWTDRATNESSFIILRSQTNGGPYTNLIVLPANSTNYSNTNLPLATTYYYVVRAANSLGSSTNSNQAVVTTGSAPIITNQPVSQTVSDASPAVFTVGVSGSAPLTFRWRKNGSPLANGGNIFGATTASLTLNPTSVADEGVYSVVITNILGSVTSSNATLSIAMIGPYITSQPANRTVNAGITVTVPVGVNGTAPLYYQWKKGAVNLSNGGKISGANTATLTLSNVLKADEGSYSLTITNSIDATNSAPMTLTVIDPAINTQPADATLLAGATATFNVGAAGTPTMNYRWRKNGNLLVNGGNILGATTASLTITSVLGGDAGDYSVIVSNSLGQVTSASGVLAVIDPIITNHPVSLTNIAGTTATFSVGAFGTTPINYQWRKNGDLIQPASHISGLGTPTLTISNVSQADAGNYNVSLSNVPGSTNSTVASLVVIDPVVITSQPLSQSEYEGSNILFTVTATGTPLLTYQWRRNGNPISGQTGTSYSITNAQLSDIGNYSVVVSNWAGAVVSSNAFLLVRIPFRIENVTATVSPHSVLVNWTTTSNSTTQVEYGLTSEYGHVSALSSAMVQNHSVLLTGLLPDTNYYFRVVSRIGPVELKSDGDTFFTDTSVIVDNVGAFLEGSWSTFSQPGFAYANSFNYAASVNGSPTSLATFVPNILTSAKYDVSIWYTGGATRSTNVPVFISFNGGGETFFVNQTTSSGGWRLLAANKDITAGGGASLQIGNDTGEINRLVVADAARWRYVVQQDSTPEGTVPAWWSKHYFGTNINASLDSDGDGYNAYKEYVIGSIPTENDSRLNFEIQPALSNNFAAIFSPCLPNRTYEILVSTNLTSWQSIGGSIGLNADGEGVVTFAKPAGTKSFYRLSVRLP